MHEKTTLRAGTARVLIELPASFFFPMKDLQVSMIHFMYVLSFSPMG